MYIIKQHKGKANFFNTVADYRGRKIIFRIFPYIFEASNNFKFYIHDMQNYFARRAVTEMLHKLIRVLHVNGM
jgi:hypothetical protein